MGKKSEMQSFRHLHLLAALVAGFFVLPAVAQTSSTDNGTTGTSPSTSENSVSSSSGGTIILTGTTTYGSSVFVGAPNISLNTGTLVFNSTLPVTAAPEGTTNLVQNSASVTNRISLDNTTGSVSGVFRTGSLAGVNLANQTSLGTGAITTSGVNAIGLNDPSAPTLGTVPLSIYTPANQSSLGTLTTIVSSPTILNVNGISGLIKQGSGTLAVSTAGTQNLVLGGTFNTINTTATQISMQATPVTISSETLALQGVTTINNNLSLQNSALLRVRINSTNPGDGYDQLNVSGDVALQGDLAITAAPSLPAGASFTILNKTSAGPISGTFAGRPQGSVVIVNNNDFIISYTGGDGNDVTLTALSRAQAWRHRHFGTTANTGTAADDADFDGDGIPNLIEKACNLDPTKGNALPVTTAVKGASLEYTYTRSVAAVSAGNIFTVEWNDTLGTTGWSSAGVTEEVQSDDGTTQIVKALVPAGSSGHRFMRLKVTPAP
jgi:hypothetical protein